MSAVAGLAAVGTLMDEDEDAEENAAVSKRKWKQKISVRRLA